MAAPARGIALPCVADAGKQVLVWFDTECPTLTRLLPSRREPRCNRADHAPLSPSDLDDLAVPSSARC